MSSTRQKLRGHADAILGKRSHRRLVTSAFITGLLLGVFDLILQIHLPYPWANLANSPAVWGVVAFVWGMFHFGLRTIAVAIAGSALLVLGVVAYYVSATIILADQLANLWSPSSLLWAVQGVVAGALFAVAGAKARNSRRGRLITAAMISGLLYADALVILLRAMPREAGRAQMRSTLPPFWSEWG